MATVQGGVADESALARDMLGVLAKIEGAGVREQAYRAAIMVVEGWGLETSKEVEEVEDEALSKLSVRIAAEIDHEEEEAIRTKIEPVVVKNTLEPSAPLLEYFKEGALAFSKRLVDKNLGHVRFDSYDGSSYALEEVAEDLSAGLLARIDDRTELWSILDRAGGSLERRKAISGLPEFAVELCGAYCDSRQLLVLHPAGYQPPRIEPLCGTITYVVLSGSMSVQVWRPLVQNFAALADAALRDQAPTLVGPKYVYELKPGDTVVIPPGFPRAVTHAKPTVAWAMSAVTPASRTMLRMLRDTDQITNLQKTVFAKHYLPVAATPVSLPIIPLDAPEINQRLDDVESKARRVRRARFRARKRKRPVPPSARRVAPAICFGAWPPGTKPVGDVDNNINSNNNSSPAAPAPGDADATTTLDCE